MIQVRFHGRGGQGVVTAAELLSVAAFVEGRHAQAFPSFGSERTGAPVVAFCRIDDGPIRMREPVVAAGRAGDPGPDAAARRPACSPASTSGIVLVNSSRTERRECRTGAWSPCRRASSRASTSAARCPSAPLLGAFAAVTGAVSLDSRRRRDPRALHGAVAEGNVAAARRLRAIGSWHMLRQIEGSRAVAEAVALCRPEVIAPTRSRRRRTSSRGSPRS